MNVDQIARHITTLLQDELALDIDEGDREHLEMMLEAFLLYKQKNAKYKNLWKVGGWWDSAHHIRHKGLRIGGLLEGFKEDHNPSERIEDALDLINYCLFFVRNVRAMLRGEQGSGRKVTGRAMRNISEGEVFDVLQDIRIIE